MAAALHQRERALTYRRTLADVPANPRGAARSRNRAGLRTARATASRRVPNGSDPAPSQYRFETPCADTAVLPISILEVPPSPQPVWPITHVLHTKKPRTPASLFPPMVRSGDKRHVLEYLSSISGALGGPRRSAPSPSGSTPATPTVGRQGWRGLRRTVPGTPDGRFRRRFAMLCSIGSLRGRDVGCDSEDRSVPFFGALRRRHLRYGRKVRRD